MTDMKPMGSGLPSWLSPAAWIWLAVALLSALWILLDIKRRDQQRGDLATEAIWPLAALYLGPLALPVYRTFGPPNHSQSKDERGDGVAPRLSVAVRCAMPGGVASGIAHLVGVPLVVATGLTIAGVDMWAMVAIITMLATVLIFGSDLVFARRQGQATSTRNALVAAVLTVVAFDVGMLGWMLILYYTDSMPPATDVRFTFLMQLGLVFGTVTVLPLMQTLAKRSAPIVSAA